MPQDHEDGTIPTVILRADMTLCVDVTAQTIGDITVDIAGQSVGAITVDIAAQTVGNIDVNIAAQGADVTIDIEAQSVGVFLQPSWATKQAEDVNIMSSIVGAAQNTWHNVIDHTVPAGHTLHIVHIGGHVGEDCGIIWELSWFTGVVTVYLGGGGGRMGFHEVIPNDPYVEAEKHVCLSVYFAGTGTAIITGYIIGYYVT